MPHTLFNRRRRLRELQRNHILEQQHQMNTTLRILLAIVAVVTGLAAGAQYLALVPAGTIPQSWINHALAASVLMLGIKEAIIAIGDIVDDGVRNGSFNIDRVSKGEATKRLGVLLIFLGLLGMMFMAVSCTTQQQDTAKQELKAIGIQIAEAASKAAAEVALQTAEKKLVELEKSPVPENPLAAMARTVAIQKAWDLVAQARTKVADFHFTNLK